MGHWTYEPMVFFPTSPTLAYMAIHSHLTLFRPKKGRKRMVKGEVGGEGPTLVPITWEFYAHWTSLY